MDREITVTYSADLVKLAVWKFWVRTIGPGGFAGFSIIVLGFSYLLISGSRSWIFGFLGAMVCVSLGLGIVSYFIYRNRALEKFKRMKEPFARFRFLDERIGIGQISGGRNFPGR